VADSRSSKVSLGAPSLRVVQGRGFSLLCGAKSLPIPPRQALVPFFLSLPVPGHSQFEYHSVSYLQKYGHMLVCYVNSRRYPHRLPRPCRGAFCRPSSVPAPSRPPELLLYNFPIPITQLESTLPQVFILENLKSFGMNTYKKQGRGGHYG